MKPDLIPPDSCLHYWLMMLSATEVPVSYQVATGITAIGAMLKRTVWVDQHQQGSGQGWNVYPNQSVLLIGPSGIGKDTAINFATDLLNRYEITPVIGGRTIENVYQRLVNLGDPAAAYIPVGEMTSFFGGKDYQSSMVQEFTDLLSTNERKDVTTKTDLATSGLKIIKRPTLTMHCGSTEEWLHKAMPDGALEGGFIGRFLVVIEELGRKHVPLPKYEYVDAEEVKKVKTATDNWYHALDNMLVNKGKPKGEMVLLEDAQHSYAHWYRTRFKRFSKATFPYANRCRDMVLRLAMLCAITREHYSWIDETDITFGVQMLDQVTKMIDKVVLPPTREAQAANDILAMLPSSTDKILKVLGRKYDMRMCKSAIELLVMSGQARQKGNQVEKI